MFPFIWHPRLSKHIFSAIALYHYESLERNRATVCLSLSVLIASESEESQQSGKLLIKLMAESL